MADGIERGSVAVYAARLGTSALGFVATVYFARELGADGLGVYFTFEAVVAVLGVLSRAGISNALVKRVSESADATRRGAYVTSAALLSAVPLLVVSLALAGVRPLLNEYVGVAALPFAIAALAAGSAQWLAVGVLRGERRIAASAGVEFARAAIRVAVSVWLLVNGFGVIGLLYGVVAGRAGSALLGAVAAGVAPRLPTRETVRSLLDFSRYTAGMQVSSLAYGWLDTLLIALLLTKADVGVYEAAWRISAVVALSSEAIGVSLAPNVSQWHAEGDTGRIETAVTDAFTYALLLVVPAVAGVAVLGDAFMGVVYRFETGGLVLLLLVGEKLLQAPKQVTQSTLFGLDRPRAVLWTNVLTLAANVVLNLLLIPVYGVYGAAVATAATSGAAAVTQFLVVRRHLAARLDWRRLGRQVGATAVMLLAVGGGALLVPPTDELRLFGLIGLGVLVYGAVVLTDPSLRDTVRDAVPVG